MTSSNDAVRLRPWQQFHVRLTATHGAIVFLLLTVMGFVYYEVGYHSELSGLQGRLRATAEILAQHIDTDGLAELSEDDGDSALLTDLGARFALIAQRDEDIDSIYVLRTTETPGQLRFVVDYVSDSVAAKPGTPYDATRFPVMLRGLREVAVESKLYQDEFAASLSGYAPLLRSSGEVFGLVGVDVDAKRIAKLRGRVLTTTGILYGAATLLLVLVAFLVGRRVRGPLARINDAAARIATGDFDTRLALKRTDEFGLVGSHFDTIAESLREREFLRDTFGRYVSRDVARQVLSHRDAASGETRNVTIVFSDLAGYSAMNEKVAPQIMLQALNAYLSAMCEVIDAHNGCIIEFLGDGILTVFNAPNAVEAHAEAAVRCALAMRERLAELNRDLAETEIAAAWRAAGSPGLAARHGVHTGPVVAGTMGSKTRVKYGLIGDAVNVAARVEEMNRALSTSILVSAETLDCIADPQLRAAATAMGAHPVRGREQAVTVYSL